uniref:WD repeat-containing protein 44-like n=1 Tax=Ananas comosus var. bracteatus TaxID=296719 RepID=A0A6V7QME3_ANACO|nr:unnamed protein product [Ananas comosus var. bracteatus]
MSNSEVEEEEEEEEESEEEEEFYESLDRILSSSCSSTSASDDDSDHHHHRCGGGGGGGRRWPRFPAAAASLEVWIAEPAPVEERRRRLLLQMGLAGDPALARRRPAHDAGAAPPEMGRSVSCDGVFPSTSSASSCGCAAAAAAAADSVIARSRSEGSVDPNPVNRPVLNPKQHRPATNDRRSIFRSPASPPRRTISAVVGRESRGRRQRRRGARGEARRGDEDEDGDEAEGGRGDPQCLIKNLDNGREFVVKEFREDGMWNKLREVGTGRQLTMEEFEMCVGRSPIVQELMRRQNVEDSRSGGGGGGSGTSGTAPRSGGSDVGNGARSKKRGGWLRSIKNVVAAGGHHRDRRSSDEKDTSSEKGGGRRSSSATDDSQDGPHSLSHGPQRTKVRHFGKSQKELTGLYMSQEIQAHSGSIWSIKFSLDGQYLASAGEDCVIHVWEVRKGEFLVEKALEENGNNYCPIAAAVSNGSPEPNLALACVEGNHLEKKGRARVSGRRKSASSDHLMVPDHVFALSEKPICSFRGHLKDVLDLSWSKSQYLLSSSMDKTVRWWDMSSNSCLKMFSHSDYVTCIQFNPIDDRYFISGSLDAKVRIWSIPDRQIVDWNDLHEMVTAACYSPDGQSALVGSHKGSCRLYDTSDNKLLQKSQIDLQNKKKKSNHKKITGFQFAPGSSSKVLITSADSRIRVIDGVDLVHKFKGFRNTNSQISACLTANGNYVICASEDSHVYVWRDNGDSDSRPSRSKNGVVTVTQSYEYFRNHGVTVAIPWPTTAEGALPETHPSKQNGVDGEPKHAQRSISSDRVCATWPEELVTANKKSHNGNTDLNGGSPVNSRPAWGLVIVTAGRGGEIRTFQNFGVPVRA